MNSRVKTLSGAKPCVFFGTVAPGVAEVSVSAVPGLDMGKLPTKSAQDSGESLIFAAKCAPVVARARLRIKT